MSDQKRRWLDRAAHYDGLATRAFAKAEALDTRQPHESDAAFLTQPGLLRARDRMRDRLQRSYEMRRKAEGYAAKAENLRAMGARNKGDAERARQTMRAQPIEVGMMTASIWGNRRVVKVNAKTVRLEGVSCPVDRAHVRVMEAADGMA